MIKLLTVIGARPQIIKAAAISRAIKTGFSDRITERILHTGQHYDVNMSQVFFDELGIPSPDYNLGVGSAPHGQQTARMMEGIEKVLGGEKFSGVMLYGDTNSTLAGAVAASKLHIPVFHVEAGLRSFNMTMPEEVNRIVCDQLASILFAPTATGYENLCREGFLGSRTTFMGGKRRCIYNSGDVMLDNSLYFAHMAENRSRILEHYGLESGKYILSTIHRPGNTDDVQRLTAIFEALIRIAEVHAMDIVIPLHPRTAKLLEKNVERNTYCRLMACPHIKLLPPVSFLEIITLEKNASIVMTDSGGVQKEAFFFKRPCVILRPETEWVEIVRYGAGIIADADTERIISAYERLMDSPVYYPDLFGDGKASLYILEKIIEYIS